MASDLISPGIPNPPHPRWGHRAPSLPSTAHASSSRSDRYTFPVSDTYGTHVTHCLLLSVAKTDLQASVVNPDLRRERTLVSSLVSLATAEVRFTY